MDERGKNCLFVAVYIMSIEMKKKMYKILKFHKKIHKIFFFFYIHLLSGYMLQRLEWPHLPATFL